MAELLNGLEGRTGVSMESSVHKTRKNSLTSEKAPADVNRLITELRVQRVAMDRAVAAMNRVAANLEDRQPRQSSKRSKHNT